MSVKELVKRLRGVDHMSVEDCFLQSPLFGHAADKLEETAAENEQLRKALEPFAGIADLVDSETEGMSDADELELHFHDYLMASWSVSMFRTARRALEAQGGENG